LSSGDLLWLEARYCIRLAMLEVVFRVGSESEDSGAYLL
jgi:hypothetical protein